MELLWHEEVGSSEIELAAAPIILYSLACKFGVAFDLIMCDEDNK